MKNIFSALFFVLISETAGIIGSVFTFSAISTWYVVLNKPFFSPPNYLFGPVWTTLYFLMGIAAFLVYKKGTRNKKVRSALSLFGIQLVLNTLWSIIFFGLKLPAVAFVEIILLWIFIFLTMQAFAKVSKSATWLLVPYILWVSFAAILNLAIVILNR